MRKRLPDRTHKESTAYQPRVVRAVISLDGKLIGGASSHARELPNLEEAEELLLSLKPVILGGSKAPTLGGDLHRVGLGFLPKDLKFKLLSVTSTRGALIFRYQRI